MQNLEKIDPRISSVVISPVIKPIQCKTSLMSCASRSPASPDSMPSRARCNASRARSRISWCRLLKTTIRSPFRVSESTLRFKKSVSSSRLICRLADRGRTRCGIFDESRSLFCRSSSSGRQSHLFKISAIRCPALKESEAYCA